MVFDLDKSGRGFQQSRVYLGPSLGWTMEQVQPSAVVTTTGTYTVQPGDSLILVDVAALVTIQLPDVRLWVQQTANQPATAFNRRLGIKDFGKNATSFNITIAPFETQEIDDVNAPITISTDLGVVELAPLIDLTGWAVLSNVGAGGGATGPTGATGPAGATGATGPAGGTPTLSWTSNVFPFTTRPIFSAGGDDIVCIDGTLITVPIGFVHDSITNTASTLVTDFNPALTTLTLNGVTALINQVLDLNGIPSLATLSMPNLKFIDGGINASASGIVTLSLPSVEVVPPGAVWNLGNGLLSSFNFSGLVRICDGATLDFSAITDPLTAQDFPALVTIGSSASLLLSGSSATTTVDFSSLTTLEPSAILNGSATGVITIDFPVLAILETSASLFFNGCTSLTSASFPALTTLGTPGFVSASDDIVLTSLDFPALATIGAGSVVQGFGNTSLVSFSFPALTSVGSPSTSFDFSGDALDVTSVNNLLILLDSLGMANGTINLSGGTNAAPTGAGATAKANLITAGNTVTTN
jgi:hypothetical protein